MERVSPKVIKGNKTGRFLTKKITLKTSYNKLSTQKIESNTMKNDGPKRRSSETEGDFTNRCVSDPCLRGIFTYSERLEYAKANMDKVQEEDYTSESEKYQFETQEEAKESAKKLCLEMIHSHETDTGAVFWMPGKDMTELRQVLYFNSQKKEEFCQGCKNCEQDIEVIIQSKAEALSKLESVDLGLEEEFAVFLSQESFLVVTKSASIEYSSPESPQSSLVQIPLNKPLVNKDGPKAFSVCVKTADSVVMVNFGDPDQEITEESIKDFRSKHSTKELNAQQSAYWYNKMGKDKG